MTTPPPGRRPDRRTRPWRAARPVRPSADRCGHVVTWRSCATWSATTTPAAREHRTDRPAAHQVEGGPRSNTRRPDGPRPTSPLAPAHIGPTFSSLPDTDAFTAPSGRSRRPPAPAHHQPACVAHSYDDVAAELGLSSHPVAAGSSPRDWRNLQELASPPSRSSNEPGACPELRQAISAFTLPWVQLDDDLRRALEPCRAKHPCEGGDDPGRVDRSS